MTTALFPLRLPPWRVVPGPTLVSHDSRDATVFFAPESHSWTGQMLMPRRVPVLYTPEMVASHIADMTPADLTADDISGGRDPLRIAVYLPSPGRPLLVRALVTQCEQFTQDFFDGLATDLAADNIGAFPGVFSYSTTGGSGEDIETNLFGLRIPAAPANDFVQILDTPPANAVAGHNWTYNVPVMDLEKYTVGETLQVAAIFFDQNNGDGNYGVSYPISFTADLGSFSVDDVFDTPEGWFNANSTHSETMYQIRDASNEAYSVSLTTEDVIVDGVTKYHVFGTYRMRRNTTGRDWQLFQGAIDANVDLFSRYNSRCQRFRLVLLSFRRAYNAIGAYGALHHGDVGQDALDAFTTALNGAGIDVVVVSLGSDPADQDFRDEAEAQIRDFFGL